MSEFTDAPLSTVIDTDATPSASGGGVPALTEAVETKSDAPLSLREDIEAAFKEGAEKPAEVAKEPVKDTQAVEKPATAPEAKAPEAKEGEAKAEPAERASDGDAQVAEKSEDRAARTEPPKNFLPDSKEVWRNVPRAVRRDIETMARDHEAAIAQHREAGERYQAIKPFDDLARSNGRDLHQSLSKMVEVENALSANPIAGLNKILMEIGPRKADGQPFSLYEVADFIVKSGPQGYQQLVAQRQQPQQHGPSEAEQLRAEIEGMKAEMKVAPIIERFALRNPRYYELQEDVALFLQSGKVPTSLSPEDRLAAAYDMAVRVNPVSNVAHDRPSAEASDPNRRADEDFSGSKSIKSSPGAVTEEVEDQAKGGESIRDSILKAGRRLSRA